MILSSISSIMMMILTVFLLIMIICINCEAPSSSVPMKIINHSGKPIELFWIDTNSAKRDAGGRFNNN